MKIRQNYAHCTSADVVYVSGFFINCVIVKCSWSNTSCWLGNCLRQIKNI